VANPTICDCELYRDRLSVCPKTPQIDEKCINKGWRELTAYVFFDGIGNPIKTDAKVSGKEKGFVQFKEMCNGYCGFDLCNGVCVMKKFVGLRSGKHAVHITEYGVHEESLVMELDGCKRETVTGDIWQPYKSAKKKPARGKEMGNLGNLI